MKKKLITLLLASTLLAMQTQAMIEFQNTSNRPVYVYFTRTAQQESGIKNKLRPQVRYQTQRGDTIGVNLFFDAAQSCQLTAIPAGSQITVPGFKAGNQPFYFLVSTLDANGLQNALNALPTTQMNGQNVARISDGSVKAYIFPSVKKWQKRLKHKVVLAFNNANRKLRVVSSTAAKRLILTQTVPGFTNLGNVCAQGKAAGLKVAPQLIVDQSSTMQQHGINIKRKKLAPSQIKKMPIAQKINLVKIQKTVPQKAEIIRLLPPRQRAAVYRELPSATKAKVITIIEEAPPVPARDDTLNLWVDEDFGPPPALPGIAVQPPPAPPLPGKGKAEDIGQQQPKSLLDEIKAGKKLRPIEIKNELTAQEKEVKSLETQLKNMQKKMGKAKETPNLAEGLNQPKKPMLKEFGSSPEAKQNYLNALKQYNVDLEQYNQIIAKRNSEFEAQRKAEGLSYEVAAILFNMDLNQPIDNDDRAQLIAIIKEQNLKTRDAIENALGEIQFQ